MFPTTGIILSLSLTLLVKSEGYDSQDNESLVAVAVLYRHGDRAVISSYPNDPYHNESYWPEGYGELLNSGKLRQYNLGRWLRNRYGHFLSNKYRKEEIFVQSSNVDRCLMSAASNLAGLYTPTGNDMWLKDLPWEPIPVHTRPEASDPYMAMDESCPRHRKLVEDLTQNNKRFQNLSLEFHEEFEILEKYTGWKDITLGNFQGLYTAFYVYSMHNKTFLPTWANLLNQTKFSYLAGLSLASETYTDMLKTLKAGPLFHNLLKFFNNNINNTRGKKFLMMSAHDGTVVAVLETMGVYDYVPPEFASMVIWELHKSPTGVYYFKIYYKNPSMEHLNELQMSSCKRPCNSVDFFNYLTQFARDHKTWEKMCKITT